MVVDRQKIFNDIQELVGEQLKVKLHILFSSGSLFTFSLPGVKDLGKNMADVHHIVVAIFDGPVRPSSFRQGHNNVENDVTHSACYCYDDWVWQPTNDCICCLMLQVVSFKWLARHFSVPANTAKKVLSEFLEKNQGKVSATYLISGWTKGPEPEHSIQLVDAGSLTERRKKLDPITSLHVYSVQPTQPKVNLCADKE